MDVSLTVKNANIIPSTRDYLTVELDGVDPDEIINQEFVSEISMYDLFEYLNQSQKNDLRERLIDDNPEILLDYYDKEEVLAHYDLDDILDYFEKNLIHYL